MQEGESGPEPLDLFIYLKHVREVTGTGPEARSSQESCAGLLVKLMTLMDVSDTVPCDSVMHRKQKSAHSWLLRDTA